MDFLPKEIDAYAEAHTTGEDATLAELNRATYARILRPRMLSGHLQGKLLEMFSRMLQPVKILEIGTYTGYSAICLARGLRQDGVLHTIDINDELEQMVAGYLEKAGVHHQVQQHVGDALQIIPTLSETWDLVFIDADKENYSVYYDLVIDDVRPGGIIIADNVLWSGKVTKDYLRLDEETRRIVDFNQKVHADPRVENVLLPVRDGLMVMRKL